jgi:tungstate transport system ATP-binding protein
MTMDSGGGRKTYSIRNLTHSYGDHATLDIASLDIPEGGVTGLIGPNGSGKTTLLKVLAFLEPRKSGELLYEGLPSDGRERELRRCVTLLHQSPYLLRRSVCENIAYGLRLRGIPEREIASRAEDSLRRVGLPPESFAARPWHRLSGGESQRVALAVRLALRPKALLLDEPTANVDESSAALIKEAVWRAWSDWGTTIVVATHDLFWLHEVATKIASMYAGRAVGDEATNLIQGEWRAVPGKAGEKRAALRLRGAEITANAPEGADTLACAALDPSDIAVSVSGSASADGLNLLSGVITQLSLERAGGVIGVADCGGISLRVRLSGQRTRELGLCPGAPVTLSFPASALKFIVAG